MKLKEFAKPSPSRSRPIDSKRFYFSLSKIQEEEKLEKELSEDKHFRHYREWIERLSDQS